MMTIKSLKILAITLAFVFVSGCAVYVRDDHYRYRYRDRGHWQWHHSSIEQPLQAGSHDIEAKITVRGETPSHE